MARFSPKPQAEAQLDDGYLIALAKQEKHPLFYGSTGPGSVMNFAGEVLKRDAAIKMEHVPFRGAAPLVLFVPLDVQVSAARNALYRDGRLPYRTHGFVDRDYTRDART